MPGYSFDIKLTGFDKVQRHFAQIPQAMQNEVADFQQRVATIQTGAIQTDFDATITSRSGNTRAAIQPFVNIGRSMGTHQRPVMNTIKWLNWGTGLYGIKGQMIHIEARNKKALAFEWHGQKFVRRSVNVKGIHPRAFIEHGIQNFQGTQLPQLIAQLQARLTQLANTVGWG